MCYRRSCLNFAQRVRINLKSAPKDTKATVNAGIMYQTHQGLATTLETRYEFGMPNGKAFGRAAIVIGISFAAFALLIINRGVWLVGISTLTDDAGTASDGLIKLLIIIASWPWEVLALLAIFGVLTLFWQVYQIFRYMDDAKTIHNELRNLPMQMMTLQSELSAFTSRFDELVSFASNTAKEAFDCQRAVDDIMPDLKRLEDMRAALAIGDGQGPVNWTEWGADFHAFRAELEAFLPRVVPQLVTIYEARKIRSPLGGLPASRRASNRMVYGQEWGNLYADFEEAADILRGYSGTIESKLEIARRRNPLFKS